MGMFDNIKIQYPLPKDKISEYPELASFNFQDEIYQTKDLQNWLYNYTIREDGSLWLEKEPDEEEVKQFITDTIDFYTYLNIDEGENDFMIDFRGKWNEGVLQSIECVNVRAMPNDIRKENVKKIKEIVKRNNKFFFKRIYLPYARLIRKIFRILFKFSDYMQRVLFKIERLLTPL